MDIVLINPYYSQPKSYFSFFRATPPLGLMYIAAYLRQAGIAARIYELGIFDPAQALEKAGRIRFGLDDAAIQGIIEKEKPRIVGLTCMYSLYYRDVVDIARFVKSVDPGITTVLGGNHASAYWNHILKDPAVDVVVCGEGEETFKELCLVLLSGKTGLAAIPGLALRQNGAAVRTPARPLIENIDDIPFPSVDLIDHARYGAYKSPFAKRVPGWGIVSSRGCPGHCVYCTIKAVWGRTWRGHSPRRVVDEMAHLKDHYGYREFYFMDDSASIDKDRWAAICQEIIDRRLDITWTTPNGIAHWTLTKETLDKMRAAGCCRITFGIESGNPETRRFLGKPYPLEQARDLIRHANRIGLWTITTNIIGFPYEDLVSIRDTVRFAKESGTDFATFYLLLPQPVSDVYQVFKKEGLLDLDAFFESTRFDEAEFEKINYILNETGCDTVHFKKEELGRLQKKAYRSFIVYRILSYLFHPWRIGRKIRSREDLRYVLRLIDAGVSIFARTFNPMHRKSSDYFYKASTPAIAAKRAGTP